MREPVAVYIGGSSSEIPRVKHWSAALAETGRVNVVSTWAERIEASGESNSPAFTHYERYARAHSDMSELLQASWLWLLMPPPGLVSAGAFFELGCFVGASKNVCISGPGQYASIFTSLVNVRCESDFEAFEFFKRIS
jgi:hypothetical protein